MVDATSKELLVLRNLSLDFVQRRTSLPALRNINLTLHEGEIVSIVGESGCGKSLTARAILRLPPDNAVMRGEILFRGDNLITLPAHAMQRIRGSQISMIFQEPMTALNPVLTCGEQCAEVLVTHRKLASEEARTRVVSLFHACGIPEAESRFESYPHQLSGGLRQRVMIAMALLCNPHLLLADEPTTALDSTMQQQILDLIVDASRSRGMACLMISHDLDQVQAFSDVVCVMYAGVMVESAEAEELFANPLHPYTKGLLLASPRRISPDQKRLTMIPGVVPRLSDLPEGCPFEPRCSLAKPVCRKTLPTDVCQGTHTVACFALQGF